MKIRESGMPDRDMWEKFFDPNMILTTLGMNNDVADVAEFGCGYGTFTIPAAKTIKGIIYALDIELEMIRITNEKAKQFNIGNIKAIQRDFMFQGSGLHAESVDYAMLFNILHLESPEVLLTEAKKIMKKGGKLGIIHWRHDPATPRGPSMEIRPKPEDCIKWAKEAGFSEPKQYDLKPYHYGIVFKK
jgi:ubiquinone/menaquinone biosynthesis C-methylase UbiE